MPTNSSSPHSPGQYREAVKECRYPTDDNLSLRGRRLNDIFGGLFGAKQEFLFMLPIVGQPSRLHVENVSKTDEERA